MLVSVMCFAKRKVVRVIKGRHIYYRRGPEGQIFREKLPNYKKMREPIRVAVPGASGRIANFLLPMIAKGDVFGLSQPIILHLLEIPQKMNLLKGVVMELVDCDFPLIKSILPTADPVEAFKDVVAAFLLGSVPRDKATKRTEFLGANSKIVKAHGQAIDQHADKNVKVLVCSNPVNTGALICSRYAPSIPKENFTALMRLDHNRAQAQIAAKINVFPSHVSNVVVWGNHSPNQFPDAFHGKVHTQNGKVRTIREAVGDDSWLRSTFIEIVQKRGDVLIQTQQQTAGMSTAKAAADHMKDWFHGTPPDEFVSMGVISDGSYGTPKDIVFSFPVTVKNKKWEIFQGLPIDNFSRKMLGVNGTDLETERDTALALV